MPVQLYPNKLINELAGRKIEDLVFGVEYTNWKGNKGMRRIIPYDISFGSNKYHTEEQWLVSVWDLDKRDTRIYALKDIEGWETHKKLNDWLMRRAFY